jgi:hypothetical protein
LNNFVCLVNYQAKERINVMKMILKDMKFVLCAMAVSVISSLSAQAAEIKDLFMSEPGVVFELLPQATRISMISYHENGQNVYATNRAANSSHIASLESRHMVVEMSAGRTVELQLLVTGTDSVVMVIDHYKTPYPDGVVTFYDTKWKALKTDKLFKAPKMEDFIRPGTPQNVVKDIKQNVTFPLIDYELEGNGMQLTARQHLAEFYTATDFARWKPYLYDSLIYTIVKNKITLTAPR